MKSEKKAIDKLLDYNSKVSCHYLIKNNGDIIKMVPEIFQAWHAGVSNFQGRIDCNEFSIGIELEGTDDNEYEQEQYHALIEITKELMLLYPQIKQDRIVGHSDIAPQRKTDPGKAFDWQLYLSSLA